ncbi:MAG: pyrroline-5-carboxylate reductase [Actinomycetes bacterium]|jgi:pyrroline-5-carboxylate reductase|nr:MAG: pyrroline-5-carboxylate reductase [Actinomycetota bacterium]
MSERCTVGVLGVGAMGEALVSGLLGAGWDPSDISLCVRRKEWADELESRYGCEARLDPASAIEGRQMVVVAVKPKDVPDLAQRLAGKVGTDQAVVSLAAGVTTATYEAALGEVPVIRAMPNTPALVGYGVTGIAAGRHATRAHLDLAQHVLGAVGSVREMDEGLMDAVTAVSGTGPAYVFLLAEAMIEAAMREGLPRDIAEKFVSETIRGAGHLLTDTQKSPVQLRYEVTSPGGTTAAAMHVLEARGFRALVEDAVRAAAQRSAELGRGDQTDQTGGVS